MLYAVRVRTADVRHLPTTCYAEDPVEAFSLHDSGPHHKVISTVSRERFNQWLTALDNAGLKVEVDYEVVKQQ